MVINQSRLAFFQLRFNTLNTKHCKMYVLSITRFIYTDFNMNNFLQRAKPMESTRVQTSSHRSQSCCQSWVLLLQIKLTSDTLGSETRNKVFQISLWSYSPWTLNWQLMQTRKVTENETSEVLFWTMTVWLFSNLCSGQSSIYIFFLSSLFLFLFFSHFIWSGMKKNGTLHSGLSWLKQQASGQTVGLLFALEKPSINCRGGCDQGDCGQSQEASVFFLCIIT